MNPSTTLTFYLLGKVRPLDAVAYVIAHFIGATVGVAISRLALGPLLRHESVNHAITTPGPRGPAVAWLAEALIAGGLMSMVLACSNHPTLTPYTGLIAGLLVALYITFESPLSGMSMNPARTFGSAIVARRWTAFWVYLTAPLAGMLLAAAGYSAAARLPVYCAKLDHCNDRRCIFHCEFAKLEAIRNARKTDIEH